ncbi:PREDICTED: uncharacterized protein DDB_G0293860-like, partial [Wasmannia auropunctata]|uniref:uncharacterized protein DDB_G0293860-like n=1 Tax=Wasmannia auropunctata TaxID=64793 RepID=UPI0005EFC492
MSTGPPRKLAKVSNVNNNNNNNNNLSPSARNKQLSSDDLNNRNEQVLTKGEHFNKKSKENFNCDRTLTSLSMQQNTVLIDLHKQLGELEGRYNTHMQELEILTKMKKKLKLRESKCKKLTDEIQKERLQKIEQIEQERKTLYQWQLTQINIEMIKFCTNLNINTSDKQYNTNYESVASHLLTSHPSTANA